MRNTILIINFNFAEDLANKETLKKLYSPHFKTLIFYSDHGCGDEYSDVHYLATEKGFFTQMIFVHFYENYYAELQDSDGVFYLHDDCILNTKTLHKITPTKAITYPTGQVKFKSYFFEFHEEKTSHRWHHLDGAYGLKALSTLAADLEVGDDMKFITYGFSDFFLIPKRYWEKDFVDFLNITYTHRLFLEIAIPTAIVNFIGKNCDDRAIFVSLKLQVLWREARNFTKLDLRKWISEDQYDMIHPIKMRANPWMKRELERSFRIK